MEKKQQFTPTSKEVLSKTIGREAKEYLKRSPPVFEDARVKTYSTGLKWRLNLKKVL